MTECQATFHRRAEVEAILTLTKHCSGAYTPMVSKGSPTQIAAAERNESVGYVYGYLTQLTALLDDEIPSSANIT